MMRVIYCASARGQAEEIAIRSPLTKKRYIFREGYRYDMAEGEVVAMALLTRGGFELAPLDEVVRPELVVNHTEKAAATRRRRK